MFTHAKYLTFVGIMFVLLIGNRIYGQGDRYYVKWNVDEKAERELLQSVIDSHPNATEQQKKLAWKEFDKYLKEISALNKKYTRTNISEGQMEAITKERNAVRVSNERTFYFKIACILLQNNNEESDNPKLKQESDSTQPINTKIPPKTLQAANRIKNAKEAYKGCPYDRLDQIKGLKLMPEQKEKIDKIREQRQVVLATVVLKSSTKKSTVKTRRTLYGSLRFFVSFYNYRIRRTLTPDQIVVFDADPIGALADDDTAISVDPIEALLPDDNYPTLDDILQGAKPEDILNGTEDEIDDNTAKKRLTRTNWYDYTEFRSMLNLDDDQMMMLAGLDAEARANLETTVEALENLNDSEAGKRLLNDCDKQFESIQKRIRRTITRSQKESFNALSLLLFDALEFPSQNMASFNTHELSLDDMHKIRHALEEFFNKNLESILGPDDIFTEKHDKLQVELESTIEPLLPIEIRDDWNKARSTYGSIYDAIKKHKEN